MDNIKRDIEKSKTVEIEGDKNVIEVGSTKNIEVKGHDNVVKIEEKSNNNIDIKKSFNTSLSFFKQKKVLNILVIVLLLILLIGGAWIRTQNLNLLKDTTTGEYIPLALDPFYFLRVAGTILDTGGELTEFDTMRGPFNVNWPPVVLPNILVIMYKIANIFGDYSLQFIDILSPVIFFIFVLIVFFFLGYILTKSKITALLGSAFLTFIPSYLYMTMASFSDPVAIGMLTVFAAMLCYSIA